MSRTTTDIASRRPAGQAAFWLLLGVLALAPAARGAAPGWAAAGLQLWILATVGTYLVSCCLAGNRRRRPTLLDPPLLVLAGLVLAAAGFSLLPALSVRPLGLLLAYLGVFYLVVQLADSRHRLRMLVAWLAGVGGVLVLLGLLRLVGVEVFPWWDYGLGYPEHFLSSGYGNHNHLAGWLAMVMPLYLGLIIYRLRGGALLLGLIPLLLLLAGFVFSQSRGGWLSLIAGVMVGAGFFLHQHRRMRWGWLAPVTGLAVTSLGFVLISTSTAERLRSLEMGTAEPSLASRLLAWKGVLVMIGEYPLTGTGPGTFATVFTRYQPAGFDNRFLFAHNDYLHFTAETGLVLVPVLVWLGVVFFRQGARKMHSRSRLVRGITLGALTGVTAILVHSAVDFNLHIPANALLFTVLAALVAAPEPGRLK